MEGINGKSTLRRVSVNNGSVIQQFNLTSQYFAEGITVFRNNIYQLTYQNQV